MSIYIPKNKQWAPLSGITDNIIKFISIDKSQNTLSHLYATKSYKWYKSSMLIKCVKSPLQLRCRRSERMSRQPPNNVGVIISSDKVCSVAFATRSGAATVATG